MYKTAENIYDVILVGNQARTIAAAAVATPASLPAGEVVVCDMSDIVLDTTTVLLTDRIRLVQGRGADQPLKRSSVLNLGDIKSYLGDAFAAATETVYHIGFNGTTGSIDPINDNFYRVDYVKRSNGNDDRAQGKDKWGTFLSDASATQEEVATEMTRSLIANFKDEPEVKAGGMVRFQRLNSDAGATDGTATSITISRGSRGGVLNAGATTFVVGDWLRIGGGATTDPVYKITALSGTDVTLDIAWQGADATAATIEYIVEADATAGDFGIEAEGLPFQFDVTNFRLYHKADFTILLQNFGTTTLTRSSGATPGTGHHAEVALAEYMSWGYEGQFVLGVPPTTRFQDVNLAGSYSPLSVTWEVATGGVGGTATQKGEVLMYVENTTPAGGTLPAQADTGVVAVVSVLDAWADQVAGLTAQVGNLT